MAAPPPPPPTKTEGKTTIYRSQEQKHMCSQEGILRGVCSEWLIQHVNMEAQGLIAMLEFLTKKQMIVKLQQQFDPLVAMFASPTWILLSIRIGILRRVTATSDPEKCDWSST